MMDLKPRTQQVLEKWGVEGQMNDEDIRNAASSFARIRVKNTVMKWVAIGGILFVATFIGLMIGSVILGIEATKEYKVKGQELVQTNGTTLGTSEAFYAVNLKLTTPLSTIKGIKSLKFNKGKEGTLQFKVVSFFFIPARTLILYGVGHIAEVLPDGTVEVAPITTTNGARSIDEEKRDTYTETSATGVSSSASSNIVDIYQCSDLLSIQETGNYQLITSLECNLTQPLFIGEGEAFRGYFNGNGHYLNITMNVNGPVALFGSLNKAKIFNLLLSGNVVGVQSCAGLAIVTYPGTNVTSSAVYTNINCSNSGNTNTVIGAFSALLRNENDDQTPIVYDGCVSQSHYNLNLTDISVPNLQGGFYGVAVNAVKTIFDFSYSASTQQYGEGYKNDRFGFNTLSHPSNHTDKKRDHTLSPPLYKIYVPADCYNFNITNINWFNMCVGFAYRSSVENSCCCTPINWDSCPYINHCQQNNDRICGYCSHTKRDNVADPSTSYLTDPMVFLPIRKKCIRQ